MKQGIHPISIASNLGLDPSTVQRNYKKMEEGPKRESGEPDFYYQASRSGRPRKLGDHAERQGACAITSGRIHDATHLQREYFNHVSPSTTCCMLCHLGLHGHICQKKPLLSGIHIMKGKLWAKEHSGWSEKDWLHVVFTDESKFNLFGSNGRMYCQRRPGEEFLERNVQKKVKHGGGSLMVWGCLTQHGTGWLHCVNGHLNAVQYCKILTISFLPTLHNHNLKVSDIVF